MRGKVIDLSHPLSSDTLVFPGDPPPNIEKYASLAEDGYNATWLQMGSHLGTHIDAPYHMLQQAKSLDDFPLEKFMGEGICINCADSISISAEDIKEGIRNETFDFLLLYTAWEKHWKGRNYFSDFPVLETEAAELICSFDIQAVGIDAPSFDPVDGQLLNHKILLGKNILLIENLCNLHLLLNKKFQFFCLPLKFSKADGSPVRACAKLISEA